MSARTAQPTERPDPLRIWLMAARPRTLPAAVAPVLVGTALAATEGTFHALRFVAALLGALLIQVGANLSNDYSDARRGADTEDRLGPVRVTAGGLVPPKQVLTATYVSFALAVLCGVYLIIIAVPASARLSVGPSVCSRIVRISRTPIGSTSHDSSTHAVRSPNTHGTSTVTNAAPTTTA